MKVEFNKVGDAERMSLEGDPQEFPDLFRLLLERYLKPEEAADPSPADSLHEKTCGELVGFCDYNGCTKRRQWREKSEHGGPDFFTCDQHHLLIGT